MMDDAPFDRQAACLFSVHLRGPGASTETSNTRCCSCKMLLLALDAAAATSLPAN